MDNLRSPCLKKIWKTIPRIIKRSLNGVEVVISAKLPDNILAHSSRFRRWDLSCRGGRGGTWWCKVGTSFKKWGKAMASYP